MTLKKETLGVIVFVLGIFAMGSTIAFGMRTYVLPALMFSMYGISLYIHEKEWGES